jgi:hypothetical protein
MQMLKKLFRKAQCLTVERQKFNATEAEILVAASTNPLFPKIGKELQAELITKMLSGEVSQDYHRGWIDCMSYLDGLVERAAAAVEAQKHKDLDNGEMTSMQMDEE